MSTVGCHLLILAGDVETNQGPRMSMINTQRDIGMATPLFSTEQKDEDNVGKSTIERFSKKNLQTNLFVLYARITLKIQAKIPVL